MRFVDKKFFRTLQPQRPYTQRLKKNVIRVLKRISRYPETRWICLQYNAIYEEFQNN